jgi:hypothetical protein
VPVRKCKPIEANDGSYGGMVLAAFDEMSHTEQASKDCQSMFTSCATCTPPLSRAVTDAQKLAEWKQLYGTRKPNSQKQEDRLG